ncbi:hypothetical protein ENUP19_0078G0016 [Entamoeba nuttalli]|uniref:Transporter, major facilitator family protein n=2 Tax=Entamoeba nuttalli TaxID=412467 RepID=K2H724_ENTNP|nr:transporter, major facilitator family protein [Entamoeba nuttalli P19]EKE38309.1 transporter, major facilitator family protein [Entamoeba nuttalli P19]|eukprot:XP_008859347.1 transporter, major facilitator family protein [Entamoeba nuttalli P19]
MSKVKLILQNIFSPLLHVLPKGFPKKKLIPLLLLSFLESMNKNSITSYAGFLVVDFHVVDTKNQAGFYSGIFDSSFYVGQFLSSFILGIMSDTLGRRPLLLFGCLGTIVCTLSLGFSFNYPWAVVSRFLLGLVNGNLGVINAFMGDLSTKENRTQVFGLIGLMNGCGMIVGSTIGAYLCRPAIQYPSVFGDIQFFHTFPYILPNIVCVSLTLIAFILSVIFLQEPRTIEKMNCKWYVVIKIIITKVLVRIKDMIKMCFSKEYIGILTCVMNAILQCSCGMVWGMIPLLMMASVDVGGFGWETAEIGTFLLISAVGIIITQLFIYKPVVNLLKPLWTNRLGSSGLFFMYNVPPCIHYLYPYGTLLLWIIFGFYSASLQTIMQFALSTNQVLVGNSVTKNLMGSLFGLSQSLLAFLRLIGPLVSSPLVAWTLDQKFPFNIHFAFFVVSLIALLVFVLSWFLPKSINEPKPDEHDYSQLPKDEEDVEMKDEQHKEVSINKDTQEIEKEPTPTNQEDKDNNE